MRRLNLTEDDAFRRLQRQSQESNRKLAQVAEAIVVAVPAGQAGKLQTLVTRPDPVVAPLQKGQGIGTLKVSLADQPLLDVPLLALDGVEQAGVMGRAWDALRLWIK